VCLPGWLAFAVAASTLLARFWSQATFPAIKISLEIFFLAFLIESFACFYLWCSSSVALVFGCPGLTFGSFFGLM